MLGTPEAVLLEAETWLGTPFHHQGRVRGAGTDCGQLLLCVYEAAGVIPHTETPYYPPDFHIHSSDPWFERIVQEFCQEISEPQAADVCLWKIGRTFSHGSIVTAWPELIHAFYAIGRIARASGDLMPLAKYPHKFYRPRIWC